MNKIFGIVFLVLIGFLIFGCTSTPIEPANSDFDENPIVDTPVNEVFDEDLNKITLAEVAKHNSVNDCWMVMNGKVYDLTNYVNHPAGEEYKKDCGTDATNQYDSIKGGRGHSSYSDSLLNSFYVGEISN